MHKRRKLKRAPVVVLVADSSRMECELLANTLARGRWRCKVVACATEGMDLVLATMAHVPDVILLGENLEEGRLSGYKIAQELRILRPQCRLVMLLNASDQESVLAAFRAGASGVFCKAGSAEALGKCIHSVHRGQIWASSAELQFLLNALTRIIPLRAVNAKGTPLLTRREAEVAGLVAEGLSNRDISQRLKLSEHTVKNYLFRTYEKLGISSRVELVLYTLAQPGSPAVLR